MTDWNPAAEAMFGWFRDEVVGQRLVERTGGTDGGLAEVLKAMHTGAAGADEASVRREVEVVTCDGRHFPAEVSVVRSETTGGRSSRFSCGEPVRRQGQETSWCATLCSTP